MASDLSDYMVDNILGWFKSTAFPSDPAAIYVALYSVAPNKAGAGGTDVTATIRAAGRLAATFGAVTARAIANSADVDFGDADAGATIVAFAVWDAATSGNLLWVAPLETPRTVITGASVNFVAGDLTFSFA